MKGGQFATGAFEAGVGVNIGWRTNAGVLVPERTRMFANRNG